MTTYCFPPTRKELCRNTDLFSRLSPKDAAHLTLDDIRYREGKESILRHARDMDVPTTAHSDCDLPEDPTREGNAISCMAGNAQFWVTWDGRITPCGMLSEPAVSVFDWNGTFRGESFPMLWDVLRTESAKIRLCPDCVDCPDKRTCMNCAAVTVTETGHFAGRPDYMCELNRAYRTYLKELAEEIESQKECSALGVKSDNGRSV